MRNITMGKHVTRGARLKAGALAAVLVGMAGVALQVAPAHALPGDYGCVAPAGSACSFTGLSGGVAPTGYVSATDASWTITHVSGATTVTDASGTGPGIAPVGFSPGVIYTLTVGDGTGAVTAGTPESGAVPPVPAPPPVPEPPSPAKTPIVFVCTGTGGWGNDPNWGTRWTTEEHQVPVGDSYTATTCSAWSPDTARPIPLLPPGTPLSVPVGTTGFMNFNGVGDFACGEGSLTTAPGGANISYVHFPAWLSIWHLDWSATFSDGVGEISGTATLNRTGETRVLSGIIVVDDGAATGQCDDSAGASNVAVSLVLTDADREQSAGLLIRSHNGLGGWCRGRRASPHRREPSLQQTLGSPYGTSAFPTTGE